MARFTNRAIIDAGFGHFCLVAFLQKIFKPSILKRGKKDKKEEPGPWLVRVFIGSHTCGSAR